MKERGHNERRHALDSVTAARLPTSAEPDRGRRHWKTKTVARDAVDPECRSGPPRSRRRGSSGCSARSLNSTRVPRPLVAVQSLHLEVGRASGHQAPKPHVIQRGEGIGRATALCRSDVEPRRRGDNDPIAIRSVVRTIWSEEYSHDPSHVPLDIPEMLPPPRARRLK